MGVAANLAAALGYPIGLVSIIVLCTERENKFVRFHALQAILLHVGAGLLFGALGALMGAIYLVLGQPGGAAGDAGASIFGVLLVLLWSLFPLLFFAAVIVAAVKAYGGGEFKLPVIGKIAFRLQARGIG